MKFHVRQRPRDARDPSSVFAEAMASCARQAILEAIVRAGHAGHADDSAEPPSLTVERASTPVAPARLAAAHPGGAAARDEARRLYERCLAHYRQVVRTHDPAQGVDKVVQVDNAGAAMAAFVAANVGALRGTPVTPGMLRSLERQLHGIARISSGWEAAPLVERQAYFEQMALLAVLVSESAQQAAMQGAAALANVQRAARGYLRQLLDLDPDRLCLGPDGLTAAASSSAVAAT